MKKTYKRITYAQRLQIEALVKAKTPFKQIAQILKLSLSAIYYEYHKGTYQIRRFVPKSTPIESITDEQLQAIQDYINNYPRLLFDGASSSDQYEAEIKKIKNFPKTP